MKNSKCKLGVHSYETIGTQSVKNIVGGFSMVPLMREIKRCKRCHKIKIYAFDISTDAHLDETLNWQPILTY